MVGDGQAMPAIRVLCGPPGCGKTHTVTHWYARAVKQDGFDAAMLLLPSTNVVRQVSGRMLAGGCLPGLLDARIYAFPDLADALLHANHAYAPEISDLQRELLVARILEDMDEEGRLEALRGSAETPGLTRALISFIDELKRAAVRTDEFADTLQQIGLNRPLDTELSEIYSRYQQTLQQREVYDAAGKFWEARDCLARGETAPFESVRLVLVDGFSDFTTSQLQVLQHLAEIAETSVVTLPLEGCESVRDETMRWDPSEDGLETEGIRATESSDSTPEPGGHERREEANRQATRTFQRLMDVFDDCRVLEMPCLSEPGDELAFVQRHAFDYSAPNPPQEGSCVTFIEAETPRDEMKWIARRIKDLLINGTGPSDICVAFRSPSGYRDLIAQVFEEQGIPVHFGATDTVASQPLVQLVMSLLNIVGGDFRLQDVANFLRSELADVTDIADDAPDADLVYTIACEAGIVRGWSQWEDGLALYGRLLQAHRDELRQGRDVSDIDDDMWSLRDVEETDRRLQQVEQVQTFMTALRQMLADLPLVGSFTDYIENLNALLQMVGLTTERLYEETCAVEPELGAENLRAFDSFCEALRQLYDSAQMTGAQRTMERAEFIEYLDRLARAREFRPDTTATGRVRVMDLHDLRQLRIAHLFLPDFTQGTFPLEHTEDTFYTDHQRERLAEKGNISIRTRATRASDEASLFCEAIAGATERLYISFSASSSDGRPQLPSIFYEEAERVLQRDDDDRIRERTSHIARELEGIYGQRSLREFTFSQIFGTHPERMNEQAGAEGYDLLTETDGEVLSRATQAAAAEARRYSLEPFDRYDGILDDEEILAQIAAEWGEEHDYSPSQLGGYGKCPFHFFVTRVLGLSAIEEPEIGIDARVRGSLVHRILAQFTARWREGSASGRPITEGDIEQAQQQLREVATEQFQSYEHRTLVAHQGLWRLMKEETVEDLAEFPVAEASYNSEDELFCPVREEATYGYGRYPPVTVDLDGIEIGIRGRIDRVDIVKDADGAHLGFAVFDYKSGSSHPGSRQMVSGQNLQLPIYIMAGESILEDEPPLECLLAAFYQIRDGAKRRSNVKPGSHWLDRDELLEAARMRIREFVRAIMQGRFPVSPASGACDYCDFRSVCRFAQWRCEQKSGVDLIG